MIIYDLCCENDHRFEGWFRSAEDFEAQLERRLITCPQCDSHQVRRVPSVVAIGGSAALPAGIPSVAMSGTAMMPAGRQVMTLYRQLIQAVVENCEDVGDAFVEEARKMHYNEAPERPIRGDATEEECEALRDEGISVIRLPSIKDEELN
ncbi:MAG: DUF1178 family protein [Dechloromonas sp.]|nr:MAG: DUF1178 family protein [Dechloromonas sp.]